MTSGRLSPEEAPIFHGNLGKPTVTRWWAARAWALQGHDRMPSSARADAPFCTRWAALPMALAVPLVVLAALPARADSGFRCGTRLVGLGDHVYDVRNRCGDPDLVTQKIEKRKVKHRVRRWSPAGMSEDLAEEREIEVLVDEWVYDLGESRFVRYVVFEDNRVVAVIAGERGTKNR